MEVFITFKSEDEAIPLQDTAIRWAKCFSASPCIIQVPEDGYEIKRRVLADKLSKEDYYILVDLLCVPGDRSLVKLINKEIKKHPDINLFGLLPKLTSKIPDVVPSGVRICKKGAVDKWPQQVTEDYNTEHANAAKLTMILGLFYANLSEC